MTHEQTEHSAHPPTINEPPESFNDEQYAPLDRPTMSEYGPFETYLSSEHRLSGDWIVQPEHRPPTPSLRHDPSSRRSSRHRPDSIHRASRASTPASRSKPATRISRAAQTTCMHHEQDARPTKRARTSFYDFAAQIQLQQHHERRRRYLGAKKRALQRCSALAARLKRANSWVQDGLVEISKQQDTAGFVRVFGHANHLVDTCYSHWNNELQNFDNLQEVRAGPSPSSNTQPFFEQLHSQARNDLLQLLTDLRSNPRFLVDRISGLPLSQVATLTAKPKWEASEALLASLSQHSGGSAQRRRRVQAFSKDLEDYASSFERSDPLSFLLHNIYGTDSSLDSREGQLRLWTWSTVCAELLTHHSESYGSLYWQALEAFSNTQEWPARTRIELFLMDILQRGAFLINEGSPHRNKLGLDPLNTKPAQDFFESAVSDLYWTLINCNDGCYPTGALTLARAILGKLPDEEHQSDFRMHFFQNWFLNHFLKTAIMFPENENMLLKIHVSSRAREYILAPLFNRFVAKFEHSRDPETDVPQNIQNIIIGMCNMLEAQDVQNPYTNSTSGQLSDDICSASPVLVLCASECIKILETLSPQAMYAAHYLSDPVMRGIGHAFQLERSWPSTKYDLLKQALFQLGEPGVAPKDIHPCLEAWSEFNVDSFGNVLAPASHHEPQRLQQLIDDQSFGSCQLAALRIFTDTDADNHSQTQTDAAGFMCRWTPETRLVDVFASQMDQSRANTDMTSFVFWRKALTEYRDAYPFGLLSDDSMVLNQPLQVLQKIRQQDMENCEKIEAHLGPIERVYNDYRKQVQVYVSSLEGLRLKLWYISEIVHSERYKNARNIALALSHMNVLHQRMTMKAESSSKSIFRPSSSRSAASSLFGSQRDDAMEILKAPTEHGGPKKLADGQIENIRQWLQQQNIDNFCIGEERLHRFCMEVWHVAKLLTGETLIESGELWSSQLFQQERMSYDFGQYHHSAPASTRPASVYSEALSTSATFPTVRTGLRSVDSDVRSTMSDERSSIRRGSVFGLFQSRLNPQILTPSLASSIGSYGRASSATTTASDIFSQPAQSVTSYSVSSYHPSVGPFAINQPSQSFKSIREKKKFRETLRTGLVCLLLSDLGSLVWSWGCETDTWMQNVQATEVVMSRLGRRLTVETMEQETDVIRPISERRRSTGPGTTLSPRFGSVQYTPATDEDSDADYLGVLRDTLDRLSQHIDPISKLQACVDFDTLAMQQLQAIEAKSKMSAPTGATHVTPSQRRRSLDQSLVIRGDQVVDGMESLTLVEAVETRERRILGHFKRQLAKLKPATIFRDLQYVAVFTPQDMLDKAKAGKAFMRLGVAALNYKKELCGSMVDVADRIIAADGVKRQKSVSKAEPSLSRAAEYWKIAALEGNRVAQRELALLYLMHPEMLNVVTSSLMPSGDIFKDDMMWQRRTGHGTNRQALCLALHWMQQAADNGDAIAVRKLREREKGLSIH